MIDAFYRSRVSVVQTKRLRNRSVDRKEYAEKYEDNAAYDGHVRSFFVKIKAYTSQAQRCKECQD